MRMENRAAAAIDQYSLIPRVYQQRAALQIEMIRRHIVLAQRLRQVSSRRASEECRQHLLVYRLRAIADGDTFEIADGKFEASVFHGILLLRLTIHSKRQPHDAFTLHTQQQDVAKRQHRSR